jgi:hypothetical protein
MSRAVIAQRTDWQISTATLAHHDMVGLHFMAARNSENRSKLLGKFLKILDEYP